MGPKITVDSANLMNKGLEVIEAHRLYDVPLERIAVVIHPQSVVHSAVEFVDGCLKAQLGQPDMRVPIQYALTFPSRHPSPAARLRLDQLSALEFEVADESVFPALGIAREACRAGPWASGALIAADEVAVERFLTGTLDFPAITRLVAAAVGRFGDSAGRGDPALEDVVALDREVRRWCATVDQGALP
jgi:1-deoxy-D-xylulose-5-phosphate reductoisomerase